MEREDNVLRAEKRRKLRELRNKGINPFPYSYQKTHHVSEVRKQWGETLKAGEKVDTSVSLAGRVMTLRSMGKASFFNIQDQTGSLQIYFRNEELPASMVDAFLLMDIGDIVGIKGFVFKTQKGELTVHAQHFELLTKTLEPLPEKYHGLQDIELKYRYRHLDLIADPQSRKVFETRSRLIYEIRQWMVQQGFMEVETPILQPIYGGAAAHPFETYHRALDRKLYLKISPELYLKRLIVGGFEKVFEIGKNFRNEGIDRTHNPEFTMMEWYEAYTDYFFQMERFESLVTYLVEKLCGSTKIRFQGTEIDFKRPWRRLKVLDGVREYSGIDPDRASLEDLRQRLRELQSEWASDDDKLHRLTWGELVMEIFELTAEPHLVQPTIVMDHPVEISPLTKRHRQDPRLVERFEPFVAGMEIGNSYSELNDPEEQYERLKEQEAKRIIDDEAHPMDLDFIHAIDVGMPPTGGVGLGIERLVMLITDQPSIRDIILFPTLR
ncbi:MAG: lysine--tRNA ligase [Bdellovibrionaceae bacterium]|nr:lysine--tRNA ligase [Pseudobdellovibrionaceae bacterium]MDW8190013.1 lysine--tRNA ligase [Pseudobdellovibrionaceae bacterium]